ncbi:uncharacterized protein LOC125795048 [Astyanax mexicanus]|uniref:uncharacterized protein LOC125795048 n=1 Tax=Astyanax mexicanus TaxID=7994 RepID=UPI0020CB0251|nr:uncharacterized protein LOC125795048 [Astyanax mexicanus]XP_049329611.1 uncharacterized protein LOC125795048 [Astyanax mexicanus]
MKRSEEVWEHTHQRIETALRRQKDKADRHRGETPSYQPGDRVWLSTRDLRTSEGSKKLSPKYIGPYKILKQINEVTYRLDLPHHSRLSNSFHVSLLKPVISGPLDEATPGETPPPPVTVDGSTMYVVRQLLDSRRRGGTLQYLVDWEGYGPEERSWIPASHMSDPGLVADFHQRHPEKPAPRPRGRPRCRSPSSSSARPRVRPACRSLSSSGARPGSRPRGRPRKSSSVQQRRGVSRSPGDVTGELAASRPGQPRSSACPDSLGGYCHACHRLCSSFL